MPENAILVHVDYAESYENKQQGDSQSAYFRHTLFIIFSAASYFRLNGKTEKICIVNVSKTKDHSQITSHL